MPRARLRIWLYRIPSLIGAIGVVLGTYWAALAFVSRRAAFLAGLIMATSILLGVEARLAKTDAVLTLTVVAAMGAMARAYLAGQGERSVNIHPLVNAAMFWTAIAFGILIKGPLILMIAGLAIVALAVTDRSASWILRLKPAIGAVWVLALVLPWFIAIIVRSGDSFFVEAIGHDLLAKVESGQESHGVPPGFYFLLFWVTFFPGAMLAGLAAPAVWRARGEPGARFLLAWLVPSWIVFELVPTKLPHYVLPLYPAIAILIVGVDRRPIAVAQPLAGARHHVVVHPDCGGRRRTDRAQRHHRPAPGIAELGLCRRRRRSWRCSPGRSTGSTAPRPRWCAPRRHRSCCRSPPMR